MMILQYLAQTQQSACELNGQPIDCGELADQAKEFLGWGIGLFMVFFLVGLAISIAIFVFWLLMLIHAIKHQSPDKTLWIVVLCVSFFLGLGLIGAVVYFFAEKKKAEQYPSNSSTTAASTAASATAVTTTQTPDKPGVATNDNTEPPKDQ